MERKGVKLPVCDRQELHSAISVLRGGHFCIEDTRVQTSSDSGIHEDKGSSKSSSVASSASNMSAGSPGPGESQTLPPKQTGGTPEQTSATDQKSSAKISPPLAGNAASNGSSENKNTPKVKIKPAVPPKPKVGTDADKLRQIAKDNVMLSQGKVIESQSGSPGSHQGAPAPAVDHVTVHKDISVVDTSVGDNKEVSPPKSAMTKCSSVPVGLSEQANKNTVPHHIRTGSASNVHAKNTHNKTDESQKVPKENVKKCFEPNEPEVHKTAQMDHVTSAQDKQMSVVTSSGEEQKRSLSPEIKTSTSTSNNESSDKTDRETAVISIRHQGSSPYVQQKQTAKPVISGKSVSGAEKTASRISNQSVVKNQKSTTVVRMSAPPPPPPTKSEPSKNPVAPKVSEGVPSISSQSKDVPSSVSASAKKPTSDAGKHVTDPSKSDKGAKKTGPSDCGKCEKTKGPPESGKNLRKSGAAEPAKGAKKSPPPVAPPRRNSKKSSSPDEASKALAKSVDTKIVASNSGSDVGRSTSLSGSSSQKDQHKGAENSLRSSVPQMQSLPVKTKESSSVPKPSMSHQTPRFSEKSQQSAGLRHSQSDPVIARSVDANKKVTAMSSAAKSRSKSSASSSASSTRSTGDNKPSPSGSTMAVDITSSKTSRKAELTPVTSATLHQVSKTLTEVNPDENKTGPIQKPQSVKQITVQPYSGNEPQSIPQSGKVVVGDGKSINKIGETHEGPVIMDPFESLRREREKQAEASATAAKASTARNKTPASQTRRPITKSGRGASAIKAKTSGVAKVSTIKDKDKRPKSSSKKKGVKKKDHADISDKSINDKDKATAGTSEELVEKFVEESSESEDDMFWVRPNYENELESLRKSASLRKSVDESGLIPGQTLAEAEEEDSEEESSSFSEEVEEEEESEISTTDEDEVFSDAEDVEDEVNFRRSITTSITALPSRSEVVSKQGKKAESVFKTVETSAGKSTVSDRRVKSGANVHVAVKGIQGRNVTSAHVTDPKKAVVPQTVKAIEDFSRSVQGEDLSRMLGDDGRQGDVSAKETASSSKSKNVAKKQPAGSTSGSTGGNSKPSSGKKESPQKLAKGRKPQSKVVPMTRETKTQTKQHGGTIKSHLKEDKDEAEINEMIQEILKSTPNPSLTLSWKSNSTQNKEDSRPRKSMTREDFQRELTSNQKTCYREVTNQSAETNNIGDNHPSAKSSAETEKNVTLEIADSEMDERTLTNLTRLADTYRNAALEAERETNDFEESRPVGKPPLAPKTSGTPKIAIVAPMRSPRFIRKHDSLKGKKNIIYKVGNLLLHLCMLCQKTYLNCGI